MLELVAMTVALPLYRIRAVSPGAHKIPLRGPLIVIANHHAWFDPLWLGRVIPRSVTPMMSSKYFDLPVINFLMRKVVRTIRVESSHYRHEAPELDEAVRRLDAGECLMIFPEGGVRRREDKLLQNFQQGVWRILRERPHTPVVACWIEGSWGSFWSHRHGPVGRNKPFDILRKITIAVGKPEILPPDLLADGPKTRHYLREKVLVMREFVAETE
jgi:acyl-[acyl-carrier-protein]-phospholipid O-acyltransferase / long-chain-fatty-acid--[acyl-carrier-protein] ligase